MSPLSKQQKTTLSKIISDSGVSEGATLKVLATLAHLSPAYILAIAHAAISVLAKNASGGDVTLLVDETEDEDKDED